MRKIVTLAFAASSLFAAQAMAQQEYGKTYIGLGVGSIKLDTTYSGSYNGDDFSYQINDDAAAYSGFIGYNFNQYIAIEGMVTISGNASGSQWDPCDDYNVSFPDNNCLFEDDVNPGESGVTGETDMRSFELVAKGTLPLGNFELFGRAGWVFGDVDHDFRQYIPDAQFTGEGCISDCDGVDTTTNNRIKMSFQDNGVALGVGGGWNIGRGSIRLQYDYLGFEPKGTNTTLLTGSDGGIFETREEEVSFKTDNPGRWLLSFSGKF